MGDLRPWTEKFIGQRLNSRGILSQAYIHQPLVLTNSCDGSGICSHLRIEIEAIYWSALGGAPHNCADQFIEYPTPRGCSLDIRHLKIIVKPFSHCDALFMKRSLVPNEERIVSGLTIILTALAF
jgi:hypothetical protein